MATYISSQLNRFYIAREAAFGQAESGDARRVPAIRLQIKHTTDQSQRRDKTGSRTYLGPPSQGRKSTTYALTTYMTPLSNGNEVPGYGPLIESALGATPRKHVGLIGGAGSTRNQLNLASTQSLQVGDGLAFGGEVRFVAALDAPNTVYLNAPFTVAPTTGTTLNASTTYSPASVLPSVTIQDRWEPADATQRLLAGAVVDRFQVQFNSDLQEFTFQGPAADLIDSTTFVAGQAGLESFPAETDDDEFDYSILPGHLGQVWIGNNPSQFLTLTDAELTIDNDIELRAREFGFSTARAASPGIRAVRLSFAIYSDDSSQTSELLQAARHRIPVPVMLQIGQTPGQVCGIYLPNLLLETPEFDDEETALRWRFASCRAQGFADDEIFVTFA